MTTAARAIKLSLPERLVHERQLELGPEFQVKYRGASYGPDGSLYVLSKLNYRYHKDSSGRRVAGANILTRYCRDGAVLARAVLERVPTPHEPGDWVSGLKDSWAESSLCALPDGQVALTTQGNRTYLLDADLERVLGAFEAPVPDDAAMASSTFASQIRVTPGGRLLCTVSEPNRWGNDTAYRPNIVAVADEPLTPTRRPTLTALGCLDPHLNRSAPPEPIGHVHWQRRPIGPGNRPGDGLARLAERHASAKPLHHWSWLGEAAPLDDRTFVVPIFHRAMRGGSRGLPFAFLLLSDDGSVLGHLRGMDQREDSPYVKYHYEIATDPNRRLAYHLNDFGLYVFDAGGMLLRKLPLDVRERRPLTKFTLLACAPDGELLLLQPEHNLLLHLPVPADLDQLGPAVVAALAEFDRARRKLRGRPTPPHWFWTDGGGYHLH